MKRIWLTFGACLTSLVAMAATPLPIQHTPFTTTTNDPSVTINATQPISVTTGGLEGIIVNGMIDSTNVQNGVINPRSRGLGAKGDGVTDDWFALQAGLNLAVATGCLLFIPPGQYAISQPLYAVSGYNGTATNQVNILGTANSTIKYVGSTDIDSVLTLGTNFFTYCYNVSNLRILGNAHVANALRMDCANHTRLDHLFLGNCTNSALMLRTNVLGALINIRVSKNEFADWTTVPTNGINIVSCNSLQLINPMVEVVTGAGIVLDRSSTIQGIGGTSESNTNTICGGVEIKNNSTYNSFSFIDTESNGSGFDLKIADGSNANQFIGGLYVGGIQITNCFANTFYGIVTHDIVITNSQRTGFFSCKTGVNQTNGTFLDNGFRTERINCTDVFSAGAWPNQLTELYAVTNITAPYIYGTNSVFVGPFDVPLTSFTTNIGGVVRGESTMQWRAYGSTTNDAYAMMTSDGANALFTGSPTGDVYVRSPASLYLQSSTNRGWYLESSSAALSPLTDGDTTLGLSGTRPRQIFAGTNGVQSLGPVTIVGTTATDQTKVVFQSGLVGSAKGSVGFDTAGTNTLVTANNGNVVLQPSTGVIWIGTNTFEISGTNLIVNGTTINP